MAANTLNILKPSVNNLTARIFVRAAGLDFEEADVWGKTAEREYLDKYPAHLTPMLETEGLPRGYLGESCAIMSYLCNVHGLDHLYPRDPGQRAMVDNAMYYLIGTLYPLITRATYPTLQFPQYPGEVGASGASDELKAQAVEDATAAIAEPLEVYNTFFLAGRPFIGGERPSIGCPRSTAVHRWRAAVDRGHPRRGVARVPARDRLRVPGLGRVVHGPRGGGARRGGLRAGGRCARLHRVRRVAVDDGARGDDVAPRAVVSAGLVGAGAVGVGGVVAGLDDLERARLDAREREREQLLLLHRAGREAGGQLGRAVPAQLDGGAPRLLGDEHADRLAAHAHRQLVVVGGRAADTGSVVARAGHGGPAAGAGECRVVER